MLAFSFEDATRDERNMQMMMTNDEDLRGDRHDGGGRTGPSGGEDDSGRWREGPGQ